MVETSRQPRFDQKHRPEVQVVLQALLQNLEHDQLVEADRPLRHGEMNVRGSALAQVRENAMLLLDHELCR
jgi:hypothetical protein